MSVLIAIASPPASTHAFTVSYTVPGSAGFSFVVCDSTTTRAPCPANRTAMASPIPRDAPVITTTLPRNENATSSARSRSPSGPASGSFPRRAATYARRVEESFSKKGFSVRPRTSWTSSFSTFSPAAGVRYISIASSIEALILARGESRKARARGDECGSARQTQPLESALVETPRASDFLLIDADSRPDRFIARDGNQVVAS